MAMAVGPRRGPGLGLLFGSVAGVLLSTAAEIGGSTDAFPSETPAEIGAVRTPGHHGGVPSTRQSTASLEDYELRPGSATHWELPGRLREISGLATTDDYRLLAHNDEVGVVFEIDYRDGSIVKEFQLANTRDPVADDFEGIAVADGLVYLVTSAGRVYESPEGADGQSVPYRVYATGVGRECEIEGLACDMDARELLLMCKEARSRGLRGRLATYRWSIDEKRLSSGSPIVVPVGDFARRVGSSRYHPSGLERHPVSGNHFVVAARQGAIAEVTPGGEVLAAKRFTAGWHRQIEGIAFGANGALIVADEGGNGRAILTVYPRVASRSQ